MFLVEESGELDVHVDAAHAAADLEAVDVERGGRPVAYRVDGALLQVFTEGDFVVLDLTGEVDRAGLQAVITTHAGTGSRPHPGTAEPLDLADAWLREA